jgi:hypothetical protein
MTIKFNIAKEPERFWWLRDDHDLIHRNYFSLYRCHEDGMNDAIYGLIIGPLHWRIYFANDQGEAQPPAKNL